MKRSLLACIVGVLTLSTLAFGTDSINDYIIPSRGNGGKIHLEPRTAAGAKTRILTVDPATARVGIGTTDPDVQFSVAGSATAGTGIIQSARYSGEPKIYVTRVNGTQGSPTKVVSGNILGSFAFLGYQETTGATLSGANVQAIAAEDYTSTAAGTNLLFNTATIGSVGLTEKMRILSDGKVGIGSTSPGTALDVVGAIQGSTSITAKGTTNQLVLGTTNTTTISSTAPAASRTVTLPDAGTNSSLVLTEGTQTINGVKTFGSAIDADISKAGTVAITSTGAGVTIGIHNTATDDFNVGSGKLVVEGDTGYVGIGTTVPSVKLDIEGSGAAGLVHINNTDAGKAGLVLQSNGSQVGVLTLTGLVKGTSALDLGLFAETGSKLSFFTNGSVTEKMIIDTSGQVGIGSASPTVALDVVGGIKTNTGITLPTTGGTATPLNYYEEGTFTVYVNNGTDDRSTGVTAKYVRVGKLVSINIPEVGKSMTGTSVYLTSADSNTTLTWPANLRTTNSNTVPIIVKEGTFSIGTVTLVGVTVRLYKPVFANFGASAADKGILETSFTYNLN